MKMAYGPCTLLHGASAKPGPAELLKFSGCKSNYVIFRESLKKFVIRVVLQNIILSNRLFQLVLN